MEPHDTSWARASAHVATAACDSLALFNFAVVAICSFG